MNGSCVLNACTSVLDLRQIRVLTILRLGGDSCTAARSFSAVDTPAKPADASAASRCISDCSMYTSSNTSAPSA